VRQKAIGFLPVGESVCLSVGVCEGGGVRPPPRERGSRAVAEGRRAECVCEAESELESVVRQIDR